MGQGQVHVVAAEHQVIADTDARQHRHAVVDAGFDQRQVRGAATHVAHQYQTRARQGLR